ncbi:hypothetical protein F5X99DRAFT_425417 [Biscogniauxia marginata]|nr:hypothetical protein F5X99DRAFT_425417 [Biscogniauxia marginata]
MSSKTEEPTRSLADSINIATRSVHTKLNRLVVYRLPLAMPPKADDASQYVSGLLHITPIYMTFESLWQDILDSPALAEDQQQQQQKQPQPQNDDSSSRSSGEEKEGEDPAATVSSPLPSPAPSDVHSSPGALDPPHPPAVCPRIHSVLTHLHLPGLARSVALRRDLSLLTGWSERTLSEQLNDAAAYPVLSAFLVHARAAIAARPHVLIAYAWVLYMALFSGGRFIRATLEGVDPAFWIPASALSPQQPPPLPQSTFLRWSRAARAAASAVSASSVTARGPRTTKYDASKLPLGFFRFDTPSDGDDLKDTFKRRLAESEAALLTPRERDEVVREAGQIFEFMVAVVGELDGVCGAEEDREDGADKEAADAEGARLLSLRSRDSVVVEKERERRKIARMAAAAGRAGAGATPAKGGEKIGEGVGVGEGKGKGGVRFQ